MNPPSRAIKLLRSVATRLRRGWGASFLLSSALFLVSCQTTEQKILSYANDYVFYADSYASLCVEKRLASNCDACYQALVEYRSNLKKATEAHARGGDFKLQMQAVVDSRKKMDEVCGKRL